MSSTSDSLPPQPENRTVIGVCGMGVDFLAAVNSFPKPDDKIRTTSFKVQGGGNACNTLVCVARLGLSPRVISKVWTKAKTFPTALVSMLLKLPKLKFAIVTLGEDGCIMIMRSIEDPHTEEMDVDSLFESLKQKKDDSITIPTYISSLFAPACHLRKCSLLRPKVAAACCRGLGSRTSLPYRTDPLLALFL